MKTNQLIQIADNYIIGNSLRVTHSASAPSSPSNGDLWWEPGARYPQPWEWDSAESIWLTPPIPYTFTQQFNITNSLEIALPVEFYSTTANRIKLVFINSFLQAGGTSHTSTNYFSFQARSLLGTGSNSTLLTWNDNTGTVPSALSGNGFRRINQAPNLYIPGNIWNIQWVCILNGSGVTIAKMTTQYWLRFARP